LNEVCFFVVQHIFSPHLFTVYLNSLHDFLFLFVSWYLLESAQRVWENGENLNDNHIMIEFFIIMTFFQNIFPQSRGIETSQRLSFIQREHTRTVRTLRTFKFSLVLMKIHCVLKIIIILMLNSYCQAVQRSLEKLASKDIITEKINGKQKVYAAKQVNNRKKCFLQTW